MCFTVSVEKKAKEAIKNYLVDNPGVKNLIDFEEDQYLVSGFSHPRLPLIKQGVVDMSVWVHLQRGHVFDHNHKRQSPNGEDPQHQKKDAVDPLP